MGSVLAGAKAGAVASLYFAGSISLFNILILLAFKDQALAYLAQTYPSSCPSVLTPGITGTAESCFLAILESGVPVADFVRTAVIAILFAIGMGVYFDNLPGPTYLRRMVLASLIMVVAMLFLGLYGLVTSQTQALLMVLFETGASFLYAVIMARLYRRFTREVTFQTSGSGGRVLIDRRDSTGKKRTFGVNSTHKVEASGEIKTFKGWLVSGGVAVKEPKQRQTSIRVAGDGLLRLA